MAKPRTFSDTELLRILKSGDRSLQDYFLLGDAPVFGCFTRQGPGLIADDDNERARATKEFLKRKGAPHFATSEELRVEWKKRRKYDNDEV
jgi:hypothetical protein